MKILVKTFVVFCAALLLYLSPATAETAKGFVFEDLNNNGKKEKNEPGIPNVAISNGTSVILTDQEGAYSLEAGDDVIIFVIKPSGYQLPLNELNQPQFYYIHKPNGSPELDFAGVAPTGSLPRSVDFPLVKDQEANTFKALFFGDPQPYDLEQIGYFERGVVAELEGIQNIPFGMSLGDLVGNDLDLFEPYSKAVAKVGIPWFNVYGNHDMNFDVKEDNIADETFEATFGPANYAFNYGKVHFIVLDDVLYPDPRDGKGYWGGFRGDQFTFIENDLKNVPKDHLVVVSFHIPVFDEPHFDSFKDEDRERLFKLLGEFPHTLSLSGHTHFQKHHFFDKEQGWPRDEPHHHYNVGTTSGDWYSGTPDEAGIPPALMRDGTPKGYAYIEFSGNEYTIDYKVANKPADYRMSIHAPKVVPHNEGYKGQITVNFFQGSEKSTLEYRVDDGDWHAMSRQETPDPALLAISYEWDYADELPEGRRPSQAVASSHIWKSGIPTNLPVGDHTIEVRATDMFGRVHTGTQQYKIVEREEKLVR